MRIPLETAEKYKDEAVIYEGRKAHIISIPSKYVGFSVSSRRWIEYDDEDHSCDVTEIIWVSDGDLEYLN